MTVATDTVARLEGVRFSWGAPSGFSLAIDRLAIARRERLMLLGPSGGGKSTLLSLIAGIVTAQEGSAIVLDQDLARLSGPARDRFRAEHLGIIFQMFNLLPYGSVIDNVLLPLHFSATRRARVGDVAQQRARATRLLEQLGLEGDVIGARMASRLSVGQQQRVAAARALIGSPEIVIADEPTSALDRGHQMRFLDLLFETVDAAGATLVMVSHDESLASRFSRVVALDTIARVSRGRAS
ncbi:MAG: ABC transporter ATP-binding protein [Hyphomicrobiaceae bacterium]|nr:ABC transporter ATP-binding protein [Hyphomicrobiaceae bacterium]